MRQATQFDVFDVDRFKIIETSDRRSKRSSWEMKNYE